MGYCVSSGKEDYVIFSITEQLNNTTEEDEIKHFSTFALSGRNGSVRWHHLPGDFGESSSITKNTDTEHHWKLGLKRHRLHTGELPWEFYRMRFSDTCLTCGRASMTQDSLSENSTRGRTCLQI
ncbi:hypothetical protein ScPMuIL_000888 [Solemya velum]